MSKSMIGKSTLLALMLVLLATLPASAAKITAFNGQTADITDQTNYLVLGKGLNGNVTVLFNNSDNGYVLDTTNTTLVIDFAVNISSYTYTASGDTANLTVTRNPTNLTFSYSGTTSATISAVNLVFNYSVGLNATQGIDTGTPMTDKATLAYVSTAFNTTYNTSTTPEKLDYIVFDPATVYNYIGTIKTADNNASAPISNEINLNMTNATTNKIQAKFVVYRYNYSNDLVPVSKAYYSVFLNDTYFTNIVPIAIENATDIGLKESDGYIEAIFADTQPALNSTFMVIAYAWDTNGTLINGYKFKYDIDPIGGLPVSSEHTKNVTVVMPSALIAPPTAFYWWQYEIYGISVLGWLGIISVVSILALLIYRRSKGLPLIPRSLGGQASIVALFAFLALLSQITEWLNKAVAWTQQNYVFIGIVIVAVFITMLISTWHFGVTRE